MYEFVWNEFCDWYLELAKPILARNDAQAELTRKTLKLVLGEILQVLQPIMPFITEELWQKLPQAGDNLLINHSFPLVNGVTSVESEQVIAQLQKIILGIRNIRGEMNIAPLKPLTVLVANASATEQALIEAQRNILLAVARLTEISFLSAEQTKPAAAMALIGEMQLLIPMDGLIDKNAELVRLAKELDKLNKDLTKTKSMLANPGYIQKAPAAVVEKEQQNMHDLQLAVNKIESNIEKIKTLDLQH